MHHFKQVNEVHLTKVTDLTRVLLRKAYWISPLKQLSPQLPSDKNVSTASRPVRERGGKGPLSQRLGSEGGKVNNSPTMSDEKKRCEEGKMLLLEAFHWSQ